jgi:hypothetical protein
MSTKVCQSFSNFVEENQKAASLFTPQNLLWIPRGKATVTCADRSPTTSADVKKQWSYTSTPTHYFVQRDYCTFNVSAEHGLFIKVKVKQYNI